MRDLLARIGDIARRAHHAGSELLRPQFTYAGDIWPVGAHQGWSDPVIAEVQRSRWAAFVAATDGAAPLGIAHEAATNRNDLVWAHNQVMTFAYVLGLAAGTGDRMSVLDWGSGIGHFARLASVLRPDLRMDYHCRDLPSLCRIGRELLPDVRFHDSDDALATLDFDLVFASGSLQYAPDWREQLRFLAERARSWLFVTRLPVVSSRTYVARQRPARHGYPTEYVSWCINRDEVMEHATSLGLRLVREVVTGERHHVRGVPESPVLRGFLFCTRASTAA